MHSLDFNLLPTIDSAHTFCSIPDDLVTGLAALPETLCRAESAASFLGKQPTHRWSSRPPQEDEDRKDEAFIRASLAEFVSMEDTLPRDLERIGLDRKAIRLNSSPHPLLHVLRELRNMEIHVRTSQVAHFPIRVLYGVDRVPGSFTVTHLTGITSAEFTRLRNAACYHPNDISRMITWFNDAQIRFGITELILRGIETHGRQIVSQYGLGAASNTPEGIWQPADGLPKPST